MFANIPQSYSLSWPSILSTYRIAAATPISKLNPPFFLPLLLSPHPHTPSHTHTPSSHSTLPLHPSPSLPPTHHSTPLLPLSPSPSLLLTRRLVTERWLVVIRTAIPSTLSWAMQPSKLYLRCSWYTHPAQLRWVYFNYLKVRGPTSLAFRLACFITCNASWSSVREECTALHVMRHSNALPLLIFILDSLSPHLLLSILSLSFPLFPILPLFSLFSSSCWTAPDSPPPGPYSKTTLVRTCVRTYVHRHTSA